MKIYDSNLNLLYEKIIEGRYSEKITSHKLFKNSFFKRPSIDEEKIKKFLSEAEKSFLLNLNEEIKIF